MKCKSFHEIRTFYFYFFVLFLTKTRTAMFQDDIFFFFLKFLSLLAKLFIIGQVLYFVFFLPHPQQKMISWINLIIFYGCEFSKGVTAGRCYITWEYMCYCKRKKEREKNKICGQIIRKTAYNVYLRGYRQQYDTEEIFLNLTFTTTW